MQIRESTSFILEDDGQHNSRDTSMHACCWMLKTARLSSKVISISTRPDKQRLRNLRSIMHKPSDIISYASSSWLVVLPVLFFQSLVNGKLLLVLQANYNMSPSAEALFIFFFPAAAFIWIPNKIRLLLFMTQRLWMQKTESIEFRHASFFPNEI